MDSGKKHKKSGKKSNPEATPAPPPEDMPHADPIAGDDYDVSYAYVGEAPDETAEEALSEFLEFRVLGQMFAVRFTDIVEILKGQTVTRVPRAHDFILGITSFRGKIIPVMDLARRMRLTVREDGRVEKVKKDKILILMGGKGPVGVLLTSGLDILHNTERSLMPPPGHLSDEDAANIEAVVSTRAGFISVLRVGEILNFGFSQEG